MTLLLASQIVRTVWAIQADETEHLKWYDEGSVSELTFDWVADVSGKATKTKIWNEVAKAYPSLSEVMFNSIVNSIYLFNRIEPGHGVVRVANTGAIERVGWVSGEQTYAEDEHKVTLFIRWVDAEIPNTVVSLLKKGEQIKKFPSKLLNSLGLPLTVVPLSNDKLAGSMEKPKKVREDRPENWKRSKPPERMAVDKEDRLEAERLEYERMEELLEDYRLEERRVESPNMEEFREDARFEVERVEEAVGAAAEEEDEEVGDEEEAPLEDPKRDKGGDINLYYGTNRNRTDSNQWNEYFGDEISNDITYGRCTVSIPPGHVQGEIERPWQFLILKGSENEKKHIILKNITEVSEAQFLDEFKADVASLVSKVGLLFIHGYNTTFAEAARRAGQIAWDIPFYGLAGFFSWASCGDTLSYLTDVERAEASVTHLEHFIRDVLLESGFEHLHIIAHSMGNKLLTYTIKELSQQNLAAKLGIIKQIILAAPDIDQTVFLNNVLPHFQTVGIRRTLYASDIDTTMKLSEAIRGGSRRLGNAGEALFVNQALDTVDASNIDPPGVLNHGYVFETKPILTDLNSLFVAGLDPMQRGLRKREKNHMAYWLFPE